MACNKSFVLGGLAVVLLLSSAAGVVSARPIVRSEAIDRDMFQVQDMVNDREAERHVDNEVKKGVQNADQSRDVALAAPSPAESSPSANANLHMLGWLRNFWGGSPPGSATSQSGVASSPTASEVGN